MNNNGIAMTRATIISTVILNFKRNRANRETVFPPEIRSYNFRIYGTLTFYGNANIVMARSYKIAFFFSFFSFFLLSRNPKRSSKFYYQIGLFTFQKILTLGSPRWKIIRPIDASRPRKRDFKFKFPCNRISRQKSRLIRPIERRNAAQSGGPNYE